MISTSKCSVLLAVHIVIIKMVVTIVLVEV